MIDGTTTLGKPGPSGRRPDPRRDYRGAHRRDRVHPSLDGIVKSSLLRTSVARVLPSVVLAMRHSVVVSLRHVRHFAAIRSHVAALRKPATPGTGHARRAACPVPFFASSCCSASRAMVTSSGFARVRTRDAAPCCDLFRGDITHRFVAARLTVTQPQCAQRDVKPPAIRRHDIRARRHHP